MLVINKQLMEQIYTRDHAIEDCKKAFEVIASKQFFAPVRTSLKTENQETLLMPAAVVGKDQTQLAVKILTVVPKNRERGLPLIPGKLVLLDEETGALLSLMDGGMLTNLRTGAVAGATAQVLHPAPVKNVVIFGCGAQGFYGLESILYAHPEVKKVTCFDYFKACAENYVKSHKARNDGIEYVLGENVEEAVREADVVHCATTSKVKNFEASWVKDGAHISAIGAYKLDMRELPSELFDRENVVLYIDEFNAMHEEAGDIVDAINNGNLKESDIKLFGDIFTGNVQGRTDEKQITVCKFVGVAPQDTVAASSIYRIAKAQGVGQVVDI
jgi:ornithine cyclodeaminase